MAILVSMVTIAGAGSIEAAPCDALGNEITCENSLPGNPESEWGIAGAGSSTIQGFATDISVNQGDTVRFKVDSVASSYRLDIYRMGYYAGAGARLIAAVDPGAIGVQPACMSDPSTGLVDCGNWFESASWPVPPDAVSGIYFAKLVRTDGVSGSSHIFFVVRDDDGQSDLLVQTSDTTWQAYNSYGGNSLYQGAPVGRAYKVSYNRPVNTNLYKNGNTFVWNSEYPMVRFLEANGYDVSYNTGVDTDRYGPELLEHKVFVSSGHDEYWSGPQRTNVEAARDAGVNLAFFSGNEMFWKTRWESSIDGSGTPYRTLVSYKDTYAGAPIDPAYPTWTGTWRDARFSPPGDGGRPENAVTGTMFRVNCCPGTINMIVGADDGDLRFWRNTRVDALGGAATTVIGTDLIGYEWDEDADNGFRPAGLIRVSETFATNQDILLDEGSRYGKGNATHSMTLYRAPSGALVFGAGTVQWAWGLDNNHARGNAPADPAAQQATVNLFADMGIQPASLRPGLVPATASTDTVGAAATVTAPLAGATVGIGTAVVTGTATDVGGTVGGVEVSTDGGATWHRADGRSSWTYSFATSSPGTLSIVARATDDSGNIGAPTPSVPITVDSSVNCPCSIWSSSTVPPVVSSSDGGAVELGVKFRADRDGFVSGVRFYKGSANTGTHVGKLWSSTGALLGSVTFSGESASGWQQAMFASPVAVQANTTYVVSYHAPNGRYSYAPNGLASAVTNGPLTALASGASGGNGVFVYGTGGFPTGSFSATNYYVDVVFTVSAQGDTTAPTVTAQTPVSGASGVALASVASATFSEAVSAASIQMSLVPTGGSPVAATVGYDSASRTVTLTPAAALAGGTGYTVSVSGAADAAGNVMAPVSWTFTTVSAQGDTTAPTVTAQTPVSGASGVALASVASATFSEAVSAASIQMSLVPTGGSPVAATVGYDSASRTVTLTPAAALAGGTGYTVSVSGAADAAGNVMAPVSWTFTTVSAPGSCPCSIWSSSTVPPVVSSSDGGAVELGVKFRADRDGFVSGVRFYKGSANTGTHVGKLWSSTGALLGSVTFSGESASGWQQAMFASPVAVQANTTYVVSYHAPNGRYSYGRSGLASAVTNGPLTALASGASGGNGVFVYGTGGFPTGSFSATNYYVDVVFTVSAQGDTTAPTVTAQTPVSGASGVALASVASATFSEAVSAASIQMSLVPTGGSPVAATVGYDSASRTVTLTPAAALAGGTGYTVSVSGAADAAGNVMAPVSWTFTTVSAQGDTTAPTVTAQTPVSGASGVALASVASATFSEAVSAASIQMSLVPTGGSPVAATVGYDSASRTVTLTPAAALAGGTGYTVSVSGAADAAGNVMAPVSWTFTTVSAPGSCPCSIWSSSTVPPVVSSSDGGAVELGVKFRADRDGFVSGVRFYKGSANTGTHVGKLWSSTGALLGSVTFSGESASGWQQAMFASPVAVQANTTYVVSYHAPNGRYSYAPNGLASAVTNGPLTALASGASGGNGVFVYGTGGFPTGSFKATNYYVDVVFTTSA